MSEPKAPNLPGLLRVPAAAEIAGITTRMFYAGILDRDIPCELLKLGELSYVRRTELLRWLNGPDPAPNAADLFT